MGAGVQGRWAAAEGRSRVVIEHVQPAIDDGRYAAKRIAGDTVRVTAIIYGDGHDQIAAHLLCRPAGSTEWQRTGFREVGNDLWEAEFTVDSIGLWQYTVEAWVDHVGTWARDLHKRIEAQGTGMLPSTVGADTDGPKQTGEDTPTRKPAFDIAVADIALALQTGANLLDSASARARDGDGRMLKGVATSLRWLAAHPKLPYDFPLSEDMIALALRYPDLRLATRFDRELPLWVDRERARFSAWYEFFPRSASQTPGAHGTLQDVIRLLPGVAAMGFDIVYLPPIHPIGTAFRKGKNNSVTAEPGDVGSPWAIGNSDGGHKAILKELGTFADFDAMIAAASSLQLEIALDIAFQCAPDHPWVKQHPDWFQIRPDGTIQYAENPPKKYQDIYPLNFESSDWQALWQELLSVFLFWIDRGVRVFRVDNPHTKALPFWEWCLAEIRKNHPEVLFLAEAFTRPNVMYGLAKMGYTESYTYFSWRVEKAELTAYMQEITTPPVSDFFRPNLWPNTPDILPEFLQTGGRAAFLQRIILAATLGASYGVYGPAYELGDHLPAKPHSEEYLDSEKYQIRVWKRDDPSSLAPLFTLLNHVRRTHPAFQTNEGLRFHEIDNEHLICYSKRSGDDVVLTVVNLDPRALQTGWTALDLGELGLAPGQDFDAHDLLSGETYRWQGERNYVALDPTAMPAHILHLRPAHLSDHVPTGTAGESQPA